MTPEQFCYWLQGFAEVGKTAPTLAQWQEINNHLQTVFHKVTPVVRGPLIDKKSVNYPTPLDPIWGQKFPEIVC